MSEKQQKTSGETLPAPAPSAAPARQRINLKEVPASQLSPKYFDLIKERFTRLVSEETFLREVSFAVQAVKQSNQLQKCDSESIIQEVLNIAQLGLSLNPIKKEAYLIPRHSRDRGNFAHLEPGYQGLIKLLTDSGSCVSVYSHPVNEGDFFEVELGTETKISHKPTFKSRTPVLFYAVAILPDGTRQIEVMNLQEIHEIRDNAEGYKALKKGLISSTPWESNFSEMARKTVIRRLFKYLPKAGDSQKIEKIQRAIEADESDYKPSWSKIEFAKSKVSSSVFKNDYSERDIEAMSNADLNDLIERAEAEQLDPITHGGAGSYNATQAAKAAGEMGR